LEFVSGFLLFPNESTEDLFCFWTIFSSIFFFLKKVFFQTIALRIHWNLADIISSSSYYKIIKLRWKSRDGEQPAYHHPLVSTRTWSESQPLITVTELTVCWRMAQAWTERSRCCQKCLYPDLYMGRCFCPSCIFQPHLVPPMTLHLFSPFQSNCSLLVIISPCRYPSLPDPEQSPDSKSDPLKRSLGKFQSISTSCHQKMCL
jgi:hypothetical protein